MMTYTVYSKPGCTFCDRAKALLASKGLSFNVIELDMGQEQKGTVTYMGVAEFKAQYPNQKTLPLILKEGEQVGGFNELQKSLA